MDLSHTFRISMRIFTQISCRWNNR